MTQEQRAPESVAAEVADRVAKALYHVGTPAYAETIAPFIAAAIRAENAACAKVAEAEAVQWREVIARYPGSTGAKSRVATADTIAAAIRTRAP